MMNIESILKGRMAETLFEELMRESGNTIYRFGYEAITQNLIQPDGKFDRSPEINERIRSIPDFIVIDSRGKTELVEVKFRWKPDLHIDDYRSLERVNKFWNARIVFVNCWEKPYFRVSNPPYWDKNKKLKISPLLEETRWKISKKEYNICEELVYKYLTPTLIPPKK